MVRNQELITGLLRAQLQPREWHDVWAKACFRLRSANPASVTKPTIWKRHCSTPGSALQNFVNGNDGFPPFHIPNSFLQK